MIHQPRYEIFQSFDDVLLIVPGGKTAYIGPVRDAQPYFESLGYVFDPQGNPADQLMDILSKDAVSNNLPQKWIDYTNQIKQTSENDIERVSENAEFFESIGNICKERGANWFAQLYHCHNRYLLQQTRFVSSLFLEIFVGLFAGTLMGISVGAFKGELYHGIYISPYALISPSPLTFIIPLYALLIGFCVALSGSPAGLYCVINTGVKIFSEEKPVFWREAAAGHSSSAYYIGKTLSATYRFTLSSLHFAAVYIFLAHPTFPSFAMMYAIIFLTFFGIYGMAAFVSTIVAKQNANLLAVVFGICMSVFCGFGPTLADAKDWGIMFIFEMSFNKWGAEALFSSSLRPYDAVYDIKDTAEANGYTLDREGFDLFMMFVIGVCFRVAAFIGLKLKDRAKQK